MTHVPMDDWEVVTLLKKAQTGLESDEHRSKWLMLEQVIVQIVSGNLHANLPITRWAYDPELGKISPQYHKLKDIKEES